MKGVSSSDDSGLGVCAGVIKNKIMRNISYVPGVFFSLVFLYILLMNIDNMID